MKDALAIHRWLLAHQIHHEIVRLPRLLTCSDELPLVLGVAPETCVHASVFEVWPRDGRGPGGAAAVPVAVICAVSAALTSAVVAAALRAHRAQPASPFQVNLLTDYPDRLICPLLLPEGLPVLVDRRLFDRLGPYDVVHTPTGERFTVLRVRAAQLAALLPGRRVDFLPRHETGPAAVAAQCTRHRP